MDFTETFWENIYRNQISKLIGVCYRYVGNKQIAEDLTHDAFIKAMDNCNSFQGKGSFDAWLRRIVVNNALLHLRDQKKEKPNNDWLINENVQTELFQEDVTDDLISQSNYSIEELFDAINSLPEHHKLVFNLYVLDKYTHFQIARELGISAGTSKSHLARARKTLRNLLYQKVNQDPDNKKRRKALLLLVFPINLKYVDCIFRDAFLNFRIQYQNSSFIKSIKEKRIIKPKYRSTIFNQTFFIIITIILGLGLVTFLLLKNKQEKTNLSIEKESLLQNFYPQTATFLKDSIILQNNLKTDDSMKNFKQLGIIMLTASGLAVDSIGQTELENNNSVIYSENYVIENNAKAYDTLLYSDGTNLFFYLKKAYLLDFCTLANESFDKTSKWEIDLTCCEGNFQTSSKKNAIKTLLWFSLKSKNNKELTKGIYSFTKDNINLRNEMSFSGRIKMGSDELEILDGEIEVDFSKNETNSELYRTQIMVKFILIVESGERIRGNYFGIYKTVD